MKRSRFRHRPTRIARREERNTFAFIIMPLAWLMGMVGGAVMAGIFLHYIVSGELHTGAFGMGLMLALIPVCAGLLRFVRGHYSSALDEP